MFSNNTEHSNTLPALASAGKHYEKLGFQLVPCQLGYQFGKKNVIHMPTWEENIFSIEDIRPQDRVLVVKTGGISGITDMDIADDIKRNELLYSCNLFLGNLTHVIIPSSK